MRARTLALKLACGCGACRAGAARERGPWRQGRVTHAPLVVCAVEWVRSATSIIATSRIPSTCASAGGNYEITGTGTYTLRSGELRPVVGPAVCLVSDLDGTMVGGSESHMV